MPMKPNAIDPRLMGNFSSFQSSTGLWRLKARVAFRGLAWRCVVGGAQVVKRLVDIVVSAIALLMLSPILAVVASDDIERVFASASVQFTT